MSSKNSNSKITPTNLTNLISEDFVEYSKRAVIFSVSNSSETPKKSSKDFNLPRDDCFNKTNDETYLKHKENKANSKLNSKITNSRTFQEDYQLLANSNSEEDKKFVKSLIIEKQRKNLPVPEEKKNDERFKINAIQNMRYVTFQKSKSTRKSELNPIQADYRSRYKIDIEFSKIKNSKPVCSVKKFNSSSYTLIDRNGKLVFFPLFTDKQIGINEYWNQPLIETEGNDDPDVMTDDEQLKRAGEIIIEDIAEAVDLYYKKGDRCVFNWEAYAFCRGKK